MEICTQVRDGDTLEVTNGEVRSIIRLAGVAAAELDDPDDDKRAQALIAYAVLHSLCLGYALDLKPDPVQPDADRYGRLIRYVSRPYDGLDVCLEMIRGGWAPPWYAGRFLLSQTYLAAERTANNFKVGQGSALALHVRPPLITLHGILRNPASVSIPPAIGTIRAPASPPAETDTPSTPAALDFPSNSNELPIIPG